MEKDKKIQENKIEGIGKETCFNCKAPILMQTGTCSICTFCVQSQGGCS